MKVFLDDTRDPEDVYPEETGWVVVRGETGFESLLTSLREDENVLSEISFDHDIEPGFTGMDAAKALCELRAEFDWRVHSANGPGALNIESYLSTYDRIIHGSS